MNQEIDALRQENVLGQTKAQESVCAVVAFAATGKTGKL
jgi:hypothetical protein